MRALCGAIITAGALIGLGLAALGVGLRYSELSRPDVTNGNVLCRDYSGDKNFSYRIPDKDHGPAYLKYSEMDSTLVAIVAALLILTLVGVATTFVGLAFHHHRRHLEMEHLRAHAAGAPPHTHTPVA